MKSIRTPAVSEEILVRVDRIGPNSARQWGTMTPPQMLAHLVESMRLATGELHTEPKKAPPRLLPLKQLAICIVPITRGLVAAPELLPEKSFEIDESKREISRLLVAFRTVGRHRALPDHPSLGRLESHPWGVLIWRHIDHHLRQFGT